MRPVESFRFAWLAMTSFRVPVNSARVDFFKSLAEYFPVRSPLASGDQTTIPIPISLAIGMRSRSTVLSTRLYSICIATNGDHPLRSAVACIRDACQAGVSGDSEIEHLASANEIVHSSKD